MSIDARPRRGPARSASASAPARAARTGRGDAARTTDAGFRHRNLPLLLLQAREGVMASFRPILNAHGITEQQWRIVRALLDSGPLEPREIGEVCRISSPSLAGVLARMDDLGLVRRERLAHDQRRVSVSLTAKSRALAAAMAPRIEAAYRALEELIGKGLIERMYATLDEAIGRLGESAAGDEADET